VEIAMRGTVLAVVAIMIGLAHPAVADDPHDSGRSIKDALPLFGTNHCEVLRDLTEQLFCGDGDLNAVAVKLTAAIQDRLNRLANRRLAIAENAEWVRERNSSCGTFGRQSLAYQDFGPVKACLLKETEERIEILSDPNFDCLAANTTAGTLICDDPSLALARTELNNLAVGLIAKMKEDDAREAFAEYERWSRERDRKCNLVGKDNVPLDELSSSTSCLAEYISRKTAEIEAAKGDPKKVFGRPLVSRLPDADAVDLCVAQIHAANVCENFLSVSRVFEIDSEVAERSALVTAEVEMVVLSPFSVCSSVASGCTGTCWDPKSGRPKPMPGSRDSWSVSSRMRIEKAFTFQKTDNGNWRCDTKSLQPVVSGVAVGGP
jgi:uncharacterized protein YecT (DUF1311 family)